MRNFLKIIFACVLLLISQNSFAAEKSDYRILVLPDSIQFESTNYLIFPEASTVFASDFINELKRNGKIETVSMAQIRDAFRKDKRIAQLTAKALHEFKYNYNVSFVDFKAIAKYFNTDLVLVVTSQTDTQNYFLRRTVWDFINIPGTTPVDPIYKLATYVALINVQDEFVIWNKTYYKKIASMEYRIIPQGFAPATEQLHKIKNYSQGTLAPLVSAIVASKILPPPIDEKQINAKLVNVNAINPETGEITNLNNQSVKKKSIMEKFKNTDFYKTFTLPEEEQINDLDLPIKPVVNEEIQPKLYIPKRQETTDYGVMMNAL